VGANVTIVEQQLNIFEVCTLQFKHYSEAADMENKKEQVKLNDELLEKVSGGNLPADDYGEYMEINDSGFCRCQNA
jgi:TolB-like protein